MKSFKIMCIYKTTRGTFAGFVRTFTANSKHQALLLVKLYENKTICYMDVLKGGE